MRQIQRGIATLGVSIFVLAIAYPSLALTARLLAEWPQFGDFNGFGGRTIVLLWRTTCLAGFAVVVCHILALPAAYILSRRRAAWLWACMAAVLLCPSMVYAFGWRKVIPTTIDARLVCVLVWALGSWPIAAMLLGTAWASSGRRLFEAARLDATPRAAFLRVVLPSMRRTIAFSWLIVFVLCFSDYSVPHACGLIVFPTELLGWASTATTSAEALWPAVPGLLVVGMACLFIAYCGRGVLESAEPRLEHGLPVGVLALAMTFALVLGSFVVPVVALAAQLPSISPMGEAVRTYGADLAWSVMTALAAGAGATILGTVVTSETWLGRVMMGWTILVGAVPGAIVGLLLVSGYSGRWFTILYDHWPVVSLSYIARFGWIGMLIGVISRRRVGTRLLEQAAVDGAATADRVRRIVLPLTWPTVITGIGVVTALSLGDVAASTMVRVPTYSPIAHVIIEKFHRLEDNMLISLSLILTGLGLGGVLMGALLSAVLQGRSSRNYT